MDKNKHLITKYLDGELGPREAARFEEALQKDSVLREEMDLYREVDEALADSEVMNLRAQLDEIHEELSPQLEKRSKKRKKRALRYAVAATIAVIISLGTYNLFFKKVTNDRIVSQFYKPYDVTLVNRSANGHIDRTLMDAMYQYENGQYRDAIESFKLVLNADPDMTASSFYSGISYFELEEYLNADKSFTKVIEHDDNLYIEQAKWYRGLVYVTMNETEKAKVQFRQIASKEGYYRDEAERILKLLRKKKSD